MHKKICVVVLSFLILLSNASFNTSLASALPSVQKISEFEGSIILGRPTNTSITANIVSNISADVYLAYGNKSNSYNQKTEIKSVNTESPITLEMTNLSPNNSYYYTVCFRTKNDTEFARTKEYSFSTPKTSGNSFNFVIQSDSHLLNKADKELYSQSMENMVSLSPDFMIDLGDTFLLDNGINNTTNLTQTKVDEIYRQQLPYFNTVTRTAPLFYALGNHESEYGPLLDGTKSNIAAMSTIARTTYIPNPIPNNFYSGNMDNDPLVGSLQNYYAYTWGDALYVVIDPYRYGSNAASENLKGDGWGWTLGKTQYDWFRKTLENSNAKYKFVFAHHAIGNIRGGDKIATLYEWGGHDQKGNYIFDEKRPGWGKPIQQVMKDAGVTIFFQGHDHLFARENVDGVVYQTIPKPAEKLADNQNNFESFNGDILMNSGFLNVTVSKEGVQVDYNRNYLVASGEQTTGVVYSYIVYDNSDIKVLQNIEDDLTTYGKNEVNNSNKINKTQDELLKDSKTSKDKKNILADNVGIGATPKDQMAEVPSNCISFAIEADPHFDENSTEDYLSKTASNIISAKPQFLIDLGDTSMLEKLGKTPLEAVTRNSIVEEYFSKFGNLPIKMVVGNHDVPINTQKGNYYSFIQGNAQFIILDPYTFSTQTVGKGGGWATSLGNVQYDWLKETLANSKSKYKFVFIHNLTGGIGKESRGGSEAADFYEWGGETENGVDEFAKMRPGWDMPIHDLLLKYGVDIVFHGHDHFYAKQEKDGIIYQLVPQPGSPGNSVNDASSYGYKSGVILPSTGYIRVVVFPDKAMVEYIKTENDGSYTIPDFYEIK